MKEQINKYLNENIDNMLDDLKGIMQIDSVCTEPIPGMPYGEGSAVALDYIKKLSEKFGLKTRNFQNYVVTADYGESEKDVALGILAHVDVVPAGEGWTYEPFDLTINDGRVYGRGAIDDKGPAVAALYAVKALSDLGIELKKNVRFIFGGGEEIGCNDIEYYQEQEALPEMLLTPDGEFPIVNAEKGIVQIFFKKKIESDKLINITCSGAVNAIPAKAVATVKGFAIDHILSAIENMPYRTEFSLEQNEGNVVITSAGKSAHGSKPQNGMNALTALLRLLSELDIEEATKLCTVFSYEEYNGKSFGVNFADDVSGEVSLALTVCNTNDGTLEFGLDSRFPVSKKASDIALPIVSKLSELGYEITKQNEMEAHYVDENSEFISSVKKAYEDIVGEKAFCICESGATYVHNTPTGIAFGAEMLGEDNGMHCADESIAIDRLVLLARVYAQAIIEICG